ncbi:FAD-binding protein [bacterium]|nr:FAD-binding protein [bacterium]
MNITRRSFVEAAGAGTVVAAMGVATGSASIEEAKAAEPDISAEYDCDVVIIGAGASGLAACVEAGDEGLSAICIESQGSSGGNERFVEGCFGANSSMQKKQGIECSTGTLIRQELEQAQYRVSGPSYNDMVHKSGENIDWLLEHGVQFGGVDADMGHELVFHRFATGNGAESYVPQMTKAAEDEGVQFMYDTHADSVITDENGAACGVLATSQDGSVIKVNAKAVILATGSYMNNEEYMADMGYRPGTFVYAGLPGHDGTGYDMAIAAGGASNRGNSGSCGALLVDGLPTKFQGGKFFYLCLTMPQAVWVNQDGERFVNEDCAGSNFCLMQHPYVLNDKTYVLLDQAMMDKFILGDEAAAGVDAAKAAASQNNNAGSDAGMAELELGIEIGVIARGDTVADVASQFGIDPEKLTATVERYNESAVAGDDADYGKASEYMVSLGDGPFYLVEMKNEILCIVGSVKTDRNFNVVTKSGEPVTGLYAIGVEGAMLWANVYTINISGACNANSVNSGRTAVAHAAATLL